MADEKDPAQSPGMKSDVWDYVRRRNELDKELTWANTQLTT